MAEFRHIAEDVAARIANRVQALTIAELAELTRLQAESNIIGLKEAAAMLKVHPEELRRNAKARGVPHKRWGSEWRFSRKRQLEWMQADDKAA